MTNSYARGLVFRRLAAISGQTITANTVDIISVKCVKHKLGNTEITLKAKSTSSFKGNKVYFYDRVPMPDTAVEPTVEIGDRKLAWTWELLDLIYESTGIRHLKEEIVNERINSRDRLYIAFSDQHPYWLGGFYVNLVKELPKAEISVNKPIWQRKPATTLFDEQSFSNDAAVLKSQVVGKTPSAALGGILNAKCRLGWVSTDDVSGFNLGGSKVTYNGPAAKVSAAKHKGMQLLQISLDAERCSNTYGELMLYY